MVDLKIIKDKMAYYDLYKDYKMFLKRYEQLGVDISYGDDECDLLESIVEYYSSLDLPNISIDDRIVGRKEIEAMANEFNHFFNGLSYFVFKSLLNNIELDEEFPIDLCDVTNRRIILTSLEEVRDLESLFHKLSQVIVYQGSKGAAYSEIFPQAFKLIVADYLEEKYKEPYVKETLIDQLDALVFNTYITLLYPSITPVTMASSLGTLLANDVYLMYKNDPERFINDFKLICNGGLAIKDFLASNGTPINPSSSDKIKKNHNLVLFNNC